MTKYIKIFWKENLMLIIIIMIGSLAQISAGIMNARALDALVNNNWSNFIQTIFIIIFLLSVYVISLLIRLPYETKVIQLMSNKIRTDITKKIEQMEFKEYHQHQSGTFISWLTNDINIIEQNGYTNLYASITMIVEMIFASIGLLFFHWSIIIFSVFISLITLMLPKIVQKKVQNSMLSLSKEQEKFISIISNIIKGYDTLFSYNLVSNITKKVTDSSRSLSEKKVSQKKALTYSAVLGALGNLIGQIGVLIITGILIFKKIISIGSITATEALSNKIFNGLGNITNVIMEMKTVDPIFEKFDSVNPTNLKKYDTFKTGGHDIELINLNYSYDSTPLWKGISFKFIYGGKYAIVGKSGSGKTTLLNIFNGKLNDYTGEITYNGNHLNKSNSKDLRNEIIYIDQSPYIFNGTISDNITLNQNYSDDEIISALDTAGLKEYVNSLPQKLNSDVGEDGRLLSGGQKQRLALARGFIRGKKVVLLDEGTSNLDKATAIEIEKNLINNKQITLIMVTHSLQDEIAQHIDGILNLSS